MSDYTTEIWKLQAKKRDGLRLAQSFERLALLPSRYVHPDEAEEKWACFAGRAAKIRNCASFLKFELLESGGSSLIEANFCRQRLCPSCCLRRSIKCYANISKVLDWVDVHDDDHNYFFLTLTVLNVKGPDLRDCLSQMSIGWNRFVSNDSLKPIIKGTIKTVEVTINRHDDTYHPHYHIILAIDKSYGPRDVKRWLSTVQWAAKWKKACRLDYLPSTNIKMIRGKVNAVRETSKYCVKPADWLCSKSNDDMDRYIYYLSKGLHGKRLISFGGIFGQARKALGIAEEMDDDLTDEISRTDVLSAVLEFRWSYGSRCYEIVEKKQK